MLDICGVNSYTKKEGCSSDYTCFVSPFLLLRQMLGYYFSEDMIIGTNDSRKNGSSKKMGENLGNIGNL